MELNKDNTSDGLLKCLLDDLETINLQHNINIELHQVEEHTEYSPERTDPCPDYYGMYYLYIPELNWMIGDYMYIDDLDNTMCILCEFSEYLYNKKKNENLCNK